MRTLNVIALMLALVYGCFAVDLSLGTQTSVLLNATAGTGSVSFLLNNTSSVAGTDLVSYNISSVGSVNVTAGSHSFVNVTSALFVVDHCAWETLEVVINAPDVAEVDITAKTQTIAEVSSSQFSHVTKPNTNQYNLISFGVTEALNVTLSTNGTVQAYFQESTYPGATCSTANCTATDGNCTVNIATNGTWHILVISADAAAEWSVLLGENNTIPTTTTTTTGNETTTTTTGGLTTTGNATTGNTTTTGGNTTTTGGLTTTGNTTTTGNANTTTTTTTTSTGDLTTGPASTTTTTTSSSSTTTTTTTTDDSGGGSSDGWKVAVGILVPVGVIAIAGGVGLWWYKRKNSRGFHTV